VLDEVSRVLVPVRTMENIKPQVVEAQKTFNNSYSDRVLLTIFWKSQYPSQSSNQLSKENFGSMNRNWRGLSHINLKKPVSIPSSFYQPANTHCSAKQVLLGHVRDALRALFKCLASATTSVLISLCERCGVCPLRLPRGPRTRATPIR
jgi:hypothetical protein